MRDSLCSTRRAAISTRHVPVSTYRRPCEASINAAAFHSLAEGRDTFQTTCVRGAFRSSFQTVAKDGRMSTSPTGYEA
eukprot:353839-Chlamydomonas_euryale.AAC.53